MADAPNPLLCNTALGAGLFHLKPRAIKTIFETPWRLRAVIIKDIKTLVAHIQAINRAAFSLVFRAIPEIPTVFCLFIERHRPPTYLLRTAAITAPIKTVLANIKMLLDLNWYIATDCSP